MKFCEGDGYYRNRHACFLLQYHLVLVTKYRRPVMKDIVGSAMYAYVSNYFRERNLPVRALDVQPDHLHVLFDAPPQLELAGFVNALKSASSRRMRIDYPNEVANYYWQPLFWSASYFVCSVSERSTATVQHYIENQ